MIGFMTLALATVDPQVSNMRFCGIRAEERGRAVLVDSMGRRHWLIDAKGGDEELSRLDRGPDGASRDGDSWCVRLVRADDGVMRISDPERIARRETLWVGRRL